MRREDDNEDNKGRPKELGGADLGVGGMQPHPLSGDGDNSGNKEG